MFSLRNSIKIKFAFFLIPLILCQIGFEEFSAHAATAPSSSYQVTPKRRVQNTHEAADRSSINKNPQYLLDVSKYVFREARNNKKGREKH